MRVKYLLLPILMITFFCCETFAFSINSYPAVSLPTETGVLLLPEDMQRDWQNILYQVNGQEGMVEYIPSNQNKNNISDLISLYYFSTCHLNDREDYNVESFYENIKKVTLNSKNGGKNELKILEKNENNIIYEYIYVSANPNLPMEHDLARIFLTDNGFHRISYTHMGELMNPEEKKNWLNILKEHSSVAPSYKACMHPQALSLLCRLSSSVDGEKS